MMKKILQYLFEYKTLSREQAKEALMNISKGAYNDYEITAFATAYLMRSITVNELQGFCDALLELCVKIDFSEYELIDIVGTGGDGKNTFNISTLACFIVAGAGLKVAKHGNYGASTISGASNVMEQLGYTFKSDSAKLKAELDKANICFLHAPLFHPALKTVAPMRKQFGLRTFFNMLGPLINPVHPAFQLLGVYSLEIARLYNYVLQKTDRTYAIVFSLDGYDEISLTGDAKILSGNGELIATPEELGRMQVSPKDIFGGNTLEDAAKMFTAIIKGNGSAAQNAVALANAAAALHCTGKYKTYNDAFDAAEESLKSGKAHECLKKLISLQ